MQYAQFALEKGRIGMNDILLWAGAAILIIGLPIILARKASVK
jgi:hypothetical protein